MQRSDRIGRGLKLKDLHTFRAVVERGSMAKAATGLALTPPAISKVIGDTEILPGVSLLDRTPHGVVTPTLYGDSALRARVIDVFVTRLNMEPEEDIQSEALFYDPLVVVTGRDTPRFRGRSVKLAQLMNEA